MTALSVAAAVVLAGCGSEAGVQPGGPGTSTSGLSASPLPTATPAPSTFPESPGPPLTGTVTLSGTVRQGAEPSCLILQTSRGQFELLGADPVPKDGDQVHVVGHQVQAMSHCMQGRPLLVEKLTIG